MFKRLTALAMVAAVGMALPALAQDSNKPKPKAPSASQPKAEVTLKVGDKAPAIAVKEWVKGNKVESFQEGKVYVVEFWATWCGPCLKTIPHLTELQKKNKDVTVIGVSVWESDQSKVSPFVKKMGDEMAYTVAADSVPELPSDITVGSKEAKRHAVENGKMSKAWMTAAGRNGIPSAFVVGKDGKIAWMGHPTNGLDEAVKKAVASGGTAEAPAAFEPTIRLASFQEGQEPKKAEKAKDKDAEKTDEPVKLYMGDKAPTLSVEEWVKGDKVKFEKGKTYVVEFWATWCGPCIAAMPHLTEVAKEYKEKGVTVIGVAGSERGTKKLEKVKKFVEDKGDGMGYTVAYDDDRSMSKDWMEPAGQGGIPCTFIVNGEGKIAWIGHPMGLDEPLKKIVDGKWDLAAEASKARKTAEAAAKSEKIMEELTAAMQGGDTEKAMKLMDDALEANPEQAGGFVGQMKFKMLGEKDNEKAYAWAKKVVDGPMGKSAQGLNAIAWQIVDPDDNTFTKKDLDLALKAATKACELTKFKDAAILDTLAKVHFDKGDVTKALDYQTKAVKALDDMPEGARDQMEEELKTRLDQYKDAAKKKGA